MCERQRLRQRRRGHCTVSSTVPSRPVPLRPVQSGRYCAKLTNEPVERTRCGSVCVLCFAASKVDNMLPHCSSLSPLPPLNAWIPLNPGEQQLRVWVGRLRVKQFLHSQLLLNSITVSCQSGERAQRS